MGDTRARNILSVAYTQGASSAKGMGGHSRSRRWHRSHRKWEASLECTGSWWPASPSPVWTRRWINSPSPVQLERCITFIDLSTDPRVEMTLKMADQSSWLDRDHSPSPYSDSNKTTEMLDLTQPMEEDDHASLSGNSNITVDWSLSAGGDLGDPPALDAHVCEFLSGTEVASSRRDKPEWSVMPKPPLIAPRSGWDGVPAGWRLSLVAGAGEGSHL